MDGEKDRERKSRLTWRKGCLLLRPELACQVPKKCETALCLLRRETVLVALEELEAILHDDHLEADLFFVVEVLGPFIFLSTILPGESEAAS
jgi:hypothetical protein